jgi:hypothetical protein
VFIFNIFGHQLHFGQKAWCSPCFSHREIRLPPKR